MWEQSSQGRPQFLLRNMRAHMRGLLGCADKRDIESHIEECLHGAAGSSVS